MLEGIVHVECNDHADVHVDELGSQIQVSFQITGIYDIYYDIGSFFNDVFSDVKFFRTVRQTGNKYRGGLLAGSDIPGIQSNLLWHPLSLRCQFPTCSCDPDAMLNKEVFPQFGLPTRATLMVRRFPWAIALISLSFTGIVSEIPPW